MEEMTCCDRRFYSLWRILRRVADSVLRRRQPALSLVSNLSYRKNTRLNQRSYAELDLLRGRSLMSKSIPADNARLGLSFNIGANGPMRSERT
jgi:hypothetical protein